jgi:hypothetical protein
VEYAPGDERQVRYLTHIGSRIPDRLDYDPASRTLHVGPGSFAPVPDVVWTYDVGGMKIISKWFGYRKAAPTSKHTSPLDAIHAPTWLPEWTAELIELLSVLRRLTDLGPAQSELLEEILDRPVITEADLMRAGVLPVPASARKPRQRIVDGLFVGEEMP